MQSAGDGKLHSAIYSVLGRDFASGLIETNTNLNGVDVNGYICKPVNCRASRAGQHTFLNGRPIVSGTVCAAVEQAYKNSTMVGKFPAFVLFVNMPYDAVDVNVHPAKTQVRFSEEKRVFDAVYAAVKNALNAGDTRPEIAIGKPTKKADFFVNMTTEQYRQQSMDINKKSEVKIGSKAFTDAIEAFLPPLPKTDEVKSKFDSALRLSDNKGILFEREDESTNLAQKESKNNIAPTEKSETAEGINEVIAEKSFNEDEVKYIGEAFNTYIIVQYEENVYIIDKHASHERIIFNKLKSEETISSQTLIMPTTVTLNESEYNAAINGIDTFLKFGFEIEDFGNMSVIVRAIPSMLAAEDVSLIVTQAAENLASGCLSLDKMDDIYHSIACKAAIKGGNITSATELLNLAKKVLSDKNVMYCPHGRPVAFTLSKKHIEKQFGRIQ